MTIATPEITYAKFVKLLTGWPHSVFKSTNSQKQGFSGWLMTQFLISPGHPIVEKPKKMPIQTATYARIMKRWRYFQFAKPPIINTSLRLKFKIISPIETIAISSPRSHGWGYHSLNGRSRSNPLNFDWMPDQDHDGNSMTAFQKMFCKRKVDCWISLYTSLRSLFSSLYKAIQDTMFNFGFKCVISNKIDLFLKGTCNLSFSTYAYFNDWCPYFHGFSAAHLYKWWNIQPIIRQPRHCSLMLEI